MIDRIDIQSFTGDDIGAHADALARLRIAVFREFPYLYDGSIEYERAYLDTYLRCSESLLLLAFDAGEVVGASTGIPMEAEDMAFRQPLVERGIDPAELFYCGESLLLPPYRGRGLYRSFFAAREAYARVLGRFSKICFCAVQRPHDHPARPRDYQPLDPVWERFGYTPHPDLLASYAWQDVDEPGESVKKLMFWMKDLWA